MSIGCDAGILTDVAILLLHWFDSLRELFLLHGSSVFVMFPLDYFCVTSDTMFGGGKGKTRDVC